MHCAACKANIEACIKKLDGISFVEANAVTSSVKVVVKSNKDMSETIINACKEIGYNLSLIEDDDDLLMQKDDKSKSILLKILIGALLLVPLMYFGMGSMYPNAIPNVFKEVIYSSLWLQFGLTIIIIGLFFHYYKDGLKAIFKGSPNMDSLVFLGSFFSLIYSLGMTIYYTIYPNAVHYEHLHLFYDSAAMILVVVSIGKYIELLSKRKAKNTINELLKLRPKVAHLVKGSQIIDIETKYLKLKDIILVNPGETIPVDGMIVTGTTSVDEGLITGESLPIYKEEDMNVIGGSLNVDGTIKVLVNKEKKDSTLSKIISLVMEASNMNTKLTRKIDIVAKYFVPTIFAIALLTFIIWISIPPHDLFTAIQFFIDVLVISCPCALGLATPISLLVGSSVFSKSGILVNKSESIENMKEIDAIVLDKTNTITKGELEVEIATIITKNPSKLDEIYTCEKYSNHPLAKGIVEYLDGHQISKEFLRNGIEPGKGVYAEFKDCKIHVGNINYLKMINASLLTEDIEKTLNEKIGEGLLPLIAFEDNEVLAIFYLKDKLKPNAKEFIAEIKKSFKRVVLLTGDNEIIAKKIAAEVGIDEVIAEVLPEDKDKYVKKLQDEGFKVMMVGDGINDSVALNRSDVGVGVASGSDVALASSDFILMKNDLTDILSIVKISKKIRKNIMFNLLWAFIYNIVFIPVAAGVFATLGFVVNPMICSALMACSSVTVCLNALTLFITARNKKENK